MIGLREACIHDAIARKLNEKGKLSKDAIAEGIINNVRKTVIRDQLTDPRFYKEMSKLLDDLVQQSRAAAAAYEVFLKKAEDLVKRLAGMYASIRFQGIKTGYTRISIADEYFDHASHANHVGRDPASGPSARR